MVDYFKEWLSLKILKHGHPQIWDRPCEVDLIQNKITCWTKTGSLYSFYFFNTIENNDGEITHEIFLTDYYVGDNKLYLEFYTNHIDDNSNYCFVCIENAFMLDMIELRQLIRSAEKYKSRFPVN